MPSLTRRAVLGSGLIVGVLATLVFSSASRADVFVLASGGTVRGTWLNRGAARAAVYDVQTDSGGRVSLAKDQVREVLRQLPAEQEYERLAPSFADTIEGQWKLAEWCREHDLKQQRTVHLLRILDYDPNHVPARLGLGFAQVSGQWVIKHDWKKKEGYELYRGRWRISQEIELLEQRHKVAQFEREWVGKLKRIRESLATDRAASARDQLLEIRDPYAVPGLLEFLGKEPLRGVKQMYIEVLGKIATGPALSGLVAVSLNDPDMEIFYECLDQLVHHKCPAVVEAYVQALKNENNVRVNRAGIALYRLDDKSAIGPLIAALVTTHKVTLGGGTSSDAVSSSFSSSPTVGSGPHGGLPAGSTGLSAGARPAKTVLVSAQNPDVLKALVAISEGASFGYDQRAWSRWHSQVRSHLESKSARRD